MARTKRASLGSQSQQHSASLPQPSPIESMTTSLNLPQDVWLEVLSYLDYFDLKRMRRVSTYLFECCQVRSVQEALFTVPLDLESLENKYEEGDEVQLHPALAEVEYHVSDEWSQWADERFSPQYEDALWIGKGSKGKDFEYFKSTVGKENATNPPVYRINFLDLHRTSDDLRNYQWNSACYSCWQARNEDDEAHWHHDCNSWLTERGNNPHEVKDLESSSTNPSESASDSSSLMDEVEFEEEAAAIDIPHYLNWKSKQECLQKKEVKAEERERDIVLLPTSVFKAVTVSDILDNLREDFMTGAYFDLLKFEGVYDSFYRITRGKHQAETVICTSESVSTARLFVDQKGSLVADMSHYRLASAKTPEKPLVPYPGERI